MVSFDNILLAADEKLSEIVGQWDVYSTAIAGLLVALLAYLLFSKTDPDTHPMLLARQSHASPVRNEGESPVYRSHASPPGMDLNAGLNVKDPGVSKWARGRNGDLRDVWRKVVTGAIDSEGNPTGNKGRIITILGSEQTIDHNLGMHEVLEILLRQLTFSDNLTKQINIIGQQIKKQGGSRVAIYLPNSVELLVTLFACCFYDLTPILMPYDQPPQTVISMLRASKADTMIAAVGTIHFDYVTKDYASLKSLIWVVDEGNKHLDWDEVPKGVGGKVNVSTWSEVVEESTNASTELPALDHKSIPKPVVAFWQSENGDAGQLVEYSHGNLVAAISAQLSSIPTTQRIGLSDLFFPADSLSSTYTLVLTMAALYYNASVVLNSVANNTVDLTKATRGISPTIIVASAATLAALHQDTSSKLSSFVHSIVHWFQTRTLTQDGVMPVASFFTRINDSIRPAIGTAPGKLRLLFVAERAGGDSPPLSPSALSDLRIFTRARVVYALTVPQVAGAVTQTAFYDYRVDPAAEGVHSHFGVPVSSVEIFLRDTKHRKVTDESVAGEVSLGFPNDMSRPNI
jgi:hypothetical protein